jgi:hypothetical protein
MSRPWDIDRRLRRVAAGKGPIRQGRVGHWESGARVEDPTSGSGALVVPAELAHTADNPVVARRMNAPANSSAA